MARYRMPARLLLLIVAALALPGTARGQGPSVDREQFHIFLLAGQSNMAGRGVVEPADSAIHPRVWMLNRDLQWVPAVDPMHFDKPIAGVGPGRSFGIAIADADPTIHVGLVPTAVGGSALAAWTPGGIHAETGAYPYDEALARMEVAQRAGELKGILWHQGESDSNPAAASRYASNLTTLIERFRSAFEAPDAPFLIGQLGRFEGYPWTAGREQVDAAQRALVNQLRNVAFVSAEGLQDNSDGLHFNAAAAREFGLRYARTYLEMSRTARGYSDR